MWFPYYASPEIVAGKTFHSAPSDIWSCGIILFALLTSHLPFDEENICNLLLKVKAGHFQMPPQLRSKAKDLIWRMLDVDLKTKIRILDIFRHLFLCSILLLMGSLIYLLCLLLRDWFGTRGD
jgi:serine/threonine-protein kinase HSL1, negative regulator of Swe1 kinase